MSMTQTETTQPGLFTQLDPLLTARAVLITVSKIEGGRLQVNICPRQLKDGENPALTVPLCVIGTAAELDAELVSQIAHFVAAHIGLNSNLNAIEKEIAEAEKAAREEAKKKHKTGNGGKKAADITTPAPPPDPAKLEPEHQQTPSLFDKPSGVTGESIEGSPKGTGL
jgi:PRTRC genetic system protein E